MGVPVLIIGETGSGKTYSLLTLNPKETFLLKTVKKPLSFATNPDAYVLKDKNNIKGNMYISRYHNDLINYIDGIDKHRPEIKTIIIDDFQYCMSLEYMDRAVEKGYNRFSEIAQHATNILLRALDCRDDLHVVVLSHSETTEDGRVKCKTVGKMIDDLVKIEGLFVMALNSIIKDGQYLFLTQNIGKNASKSPAGMLELYMPNDLSIVLDKINNFYHLGKYAQPIVNKISNQPINQPAKGAIN